MLAPDYRHPLPGRAAFAGCLWARTSVAFPAGEGSSVLACCLLETYAVAVRYRSGIADRSCHWMFL